MAGMPWISTTDMVEVDRLMMSADWGIDLVRMMESAGRNLAHVAREQFLGGDPRGKRCVVLAGTGGNGGGALVCARRLANWGAVVSVFTTKAASAFTEVPGQNLAICERMGLGVCVVGSDSELELPADVDLVIDGIIGYSLKGAPRGAALVMINAANDAAAPTLSLDVPSGIDSTHGVVDVAVKAAATMNLALPKVGLKDPLVRPFVGDLFLADISVPVELYAADSLGLNVDHLFALQDVIPVAFD